MGSMFYGATEIIFKRAEVLRKNPTLAEKLLWVHLKRKQLGVRFKRQHPIWMYIADFYSHELKLVIELDGSIHELQEIMEHDKLREEDKVSFGIKVIRFTNSEIISDIQSVVGKIQSIVNEIKGSQTSNE